MIDSVQYKQWISTDRSTLVTLSKPAEKFVELFCDQLKTLLTHSFIAKQQSIFQTEVRSNLKHGEFQVIADFSENYSLILYYKMRYRGFTGIMHKQLPFVIYYCESGEIHQLSYIIISDCLHHACMIELLFMFFRDAL